MSSAQTVMTVLGPIPADDLGVTLTHEHILSDLPCLQGSPALDGGLPFADRPPDLAGRPQDVAGAGSRDPALRRDDCVLADLGLATEELREYRDLGGGAIVDVTLPDVGRDAQTSAAISRATGLHVVCGCGHLLHFTQPPGVEVESEQAVAESLIAELANGIGDTGIRPGIIGELGVSDPPHPLEEKILRAAVRAQKASGRPLYVRMAPGSRDGRRTLALLQDADAVMDKIVLGHLDVALSGGETSFEEAVDYQLTLAHSGCFIEYDTVGAGTYYEAIGAEPAFRCPSDGERAATLSRLFDAGVGDQLVLSQDVCLRQYLKRHGGLGYGHFLQEFQEELRRVGLDRAALDQLLIANPRRLLAA